MSAGRKLWPSIGAIALLTVAVLAGCERGGERDDDGQGAKRESAPAVPGEDVIKNTGFESLGDPATDDIAYLTRLAVMRSHLLVGMELFHTGALDTARIQLNYPGDALYGGMKSSLDARSAPEFGQPLKRLAAEINGDVTATALEVVVKEVLSSIEKAERAVDARISSRVETKLRITINLTHAAARKYSAAVVNCAIIDGRDYQDAYGLARVAKQIVESIDAGDEEPLAAALQKISEELTLIQAAWPEIVPPERVEVDASLLHDAAAQIEKVAGDLK